MSDELRATIILSELLRLFTEKPSESGKMSRINIDLAKQKIAELSRALDTEGMTPFIEETAPNTFVLKHSNEDL